jgi:hypothetical protein
MTEDRVRVLRLVEYDGPRSWVESTLAHAIHGRKLVSTLHGHRGCITAVTLTQYPEILERARESQEPPTHD